jgi:hypothetical protein
MNIGQKLYTIYGWVTVTGKRHSVVNNRVVWYGIDEQGVKRDITDDILKDEPIDNTKEVEKEKNNEEHKRDIQDKLKTLSSKTFDVNVSNFPKTESLSDVLNEIKKSQDETTEAVKRIPEIKVPELKVKSLKISELKIPDHTEEYGKWKNEIIEALKIDIPAVDLKPVISVLKNIEIQDHKDEYRLWKDQIVEALKIEIPKVDLKPVIEAINKIKFPTFPRPNDYTELLEEIKKSLGKELNIAPVLEAIKNIPKFEIPESLIYKDHLKVTPDRVGGGGGGGLTAIDSARLQSLSTEAKQLPDNHQVTVSNIANTPVITGFATEAKQIPVLSEVSFTTTTAQAVATTDVTGYLGVSVQILTQGTTSTVTFQGSNNNTNWVNVSLAISTSVTTAPVSSTTAASSYYGPLHFKYFRLNVTGITDGTTAGVIQFSTQYAPHNYITTSAVTVAASATSVAKAEDAVAASADVGIPALAVRRDTAASNVSAEGDYEQLHTDVNGKLWAIAELSAGTAAIGKLTANSGVDIGDVDVTSCALPTGAATETTLGTVHGHVDSIDTKTPALGQALAAASVPVVLTAAQLTTLTPPAAITGFATSALQTQPGVDIGDVTINNSTGASAVNIQDGGNTITVDGTVAVTNAGITTIAGAVAGTEMQCDVLTMPTVTVTHSVTGVGHGVKVVTTAGTDVALAASTACKKVDIQAQTDNTSAIAVGGSGVDATIATGTGIFLNPGDVYSLEIDNLADIYIDSLVNGEGVRFTYFT